MSDCNVYYYHEPDNLDLKIKERGSWVFSLTVYTSDGITPFDFTGYVGHCDFVQADTPIGTTPVAVVTPTVTIPLPTNGIIILSLTKAQTEAMNAATNMLYDLFCDNVSTGDSRCFVQGSVTLVQRYTAP